MKLVTVPTPITIKLVTREGQEIAEPVEFKKFIINAIDSYQEGIKTIKQLRQASKIVSIAEGSTDTMVFEDEDYDLLKAATEAFSPKLFPKIGMQYLPYHDVIDKAETLKK